MREASLRGNFHVGTPGCACEAAMSRAYDKAASVKNPDSNVNDTSTTHTTNTRM